MDDRRKPERIAADLLVRLHRVEEQNDDRSDGEDQKGHDPRGASEPAERQVPSRNHRQHSVPRRRSHR